MKKFTICCFALLSCCIATETGAQGFGSYLDKGVGGGLGVSSFDGGTSVGASAGYVFSPLVEAQVSATRFSYDNVDASDFAATGITPSLIVYPVRQSADIPVSVSLSGGYTFMSFSGAYIDDIEERGGDVSGNSYSAGGSVFRMFGVTPKFQIIPSISVGYQNSEMEFSTTVGSEVNTEDGVGFGAGVILLFETTDSLFFTVTPTVSVFEGDPSYGVSASIALPQ